MPQLQLKDLKKTLKSQFQISKLRPGQEDVIRSVMARKNTLAIMPTGAGKSLCYQLPGLHLTGTTVVISPLISLMKDQREKLEELGVDAMEFNSVISQKIQNQNLSRFGEDEGEFIYTTPERLEDPDFLKKLKKSKVDFVVIDEAHCVSQWGHDFRPAYLNIAHALKNLGQPPVLALTATATPEVVSDIQNQLKLKELNVFRTPLMRENLYLEGHLAESEEDKKESLLNYLNEMTGSGIIYVSTVKAADEIQEFLNSNGIPALIYHGKLKPKEREENQNEFMNNTRIMVATNAFGMGIDKSDIRFVIHFNFPGSLEAYYQEAGRAGRDGKEARCILFYLKKDKSTQSLFIARKYPSLEDLTLTYKTLQKMSTREKEISKTKVEEKLKDLSSRKVALLIAYLKQLEVVTEKKKNILRLPKATLSTDELGKIADSYNRRQERDREKLKQVIIYGQTAMCRWRILSQYFEEETNWTSCGHCDNCERSIIDEVLKDQNLTLT